MLRADEVVDLFVGSGIHFATGVPDSLLMHFCNEISKCDKITHITSANEGNAVALACGYNLATDKIPLVYMQNSGLGNIINPLLSLADKQVYNFPMLYIIGWRGEPNMKDEPQHITQGLLSEEILRAVGLRYEIITPDTDMDEFRNILSDAIRCISIEKEPVAFLVKKGTFLEDSELEDENTKTFTRRDALNRIVDALPANGVIVSTTGKTSRELYEIRNEHNEGHEKDFLTVGSMGHASQIALAVSLFKKNTTVCCVDGEGAVLMHMGALAVNGALAGSNFIHVLINNGVHDSVGGQPNYGKGIDFSKIAYQCGYANVYRTDKPGKIEEILNATHTGAIFLQIDVDMGSSAVLSRPKEKPIENKTLFMEYLNKHEE